MQTRIEIKNSIKNWLNTVFQDTTVPENVLALNFGIQRTHDEFEIYLTGHDDFYYDHDTWLLSVVFEPQANFKGLGINSLDLSDQEIYDIYKHEVSEFIEQKIKSYFQSVHYFNCMFPAGMPELLFEK